MMIAGVLSLAVAGQHKMLMSLRDLSRSLSAPAANIAPVNSDAASRGDTVAQLGAPALLLLNADALVLPMESGAAQVTARVRDTKGKPVAGVEVHFTGELGSVSPASVTTDGNGVALATFTAGGAQGQAVIMAEANDLTGEAAIQLFNPGGSALAHTLALEFDAGKLDPNQEAPVSAVLRDAAGQPVAGELVSLFGSLGEISPASALSDANGRVTATYRAGNTPGQAMITALAGYASKSVALQVGNAPTEPGTPGQPTHKAFLPVVTR
jgi:adhesin/invasin